MDSFSNAIKTTSPDLIDNNIKKTIHINPVKVINNGENVIIDFSVDGVVMPGKYMINRYGMNLLLNNIEDENNRHIDVDLVLKKSLTNTP